jgi:hypothetical protein
MSTRRIDTFPLGLFQKHPIGYWETACWSNPRLLPYTYTHIDMADPGCPVQDRCQTVWQLFPQNDTKSVQKYFTTFQESASVSW